jgi:hypothetical protein
VHTRQTRNNFLLALIQKPESVMKGEVEAGRQKKKEEEKIDKDERKRKKMEGKKSTKMQQINSWQRTCWKLLLENH